MVSTYVNPAYAFQRSRDQDAKPPAHHPVLIVGGGPTGLYCALDLAKQGIPSVVLDEDNTVSYGSRALCFSKRTLEILDRVGCGQAMVDKGVTWQLGKVFFHERQVYEFNLLPENGHQRPAFINIQQYYPEEFLVNRIQDFPEIDLRWQTKVTQVKKIGEQVEVSVSTPEGEYRMTCDYVLVADGANSPIRDSLGLSSSGQIFNDTFLIADILMKADFPTERWFWFDPPFHPGQSVLLHKQPDGCWRIDFQLGPNADRQAWRDPEKVRPLVQAMLGDDIEFEFEWLSVYSFRCRRMDSFLHQDRIIFVGDSAHQVSPFGARGANGALQSAENLIWKLARVLKQQAPARLLQTYDQERSQGADENILNSTRATDFITPKNRVTRLFRDTALELAEHYAFARPLVNSGRLSTPCIYASSTLNTPDTRSDQFPAALRPGASCKDAPITALSTAYRSEPWLLQQLGDRFVLLVDGRDLANEDLAALKSIPDLEILMIADQLADQPVPNYTTLKDHLGLVTERYDLKPGTAYLIRPDQHVAARWRQVQAASVRAAMQRALGKE
ncbi:FAD-dependent oxidoreductase [Thiothrix eikelboomii]|uniref:FAD-dependent oxidoreductase n=1 Tax=Thiothrix eikelboomii TaxID=92487 RepID=UPI003BB0F855